MQESGGLLFHLVVYIHRSSFLVRRCEGSEEKRDVSSDHCAVLVSCAPAPTGTTAY